MSNWLKLEGDVCAVTGALGGMGVEICREFARNGANVVLLDLDEEKVKAAAADLAAEFGIHAEGYKMNAPTRPRFRLPSTPPSPTSAASTFSSTPPASCASPPWRTCR